MSMWEFESLAEQAVALVGESDWPPAKRRDAIAGIYRMVGQFDVSFTHFRSTAVLVEAAFFFHLPVPAHPEYAARRQELDALVAAGKDAWLSDATGETEAFFLSGPRDGEPGLWFDVEMGLWEKAVDAGRLTGLAALPVTPWSTRDTVVTLLSLAIEQGARHRNLIKMLHGFAVQSTAELRTDDLDLQRIRDAPALHAVLGSATENWIDERFDARDAIPFLSGEAKAFALWWCAPYR